VEHARYRGTSARSVRSRTDRGVSLSTMGMFGTAPMTRSSGVRIDADPRVGAYLPAMNGRRRARPKRSGMRPETRSLAGDAVVKKAIGPHPVSANNPCPFLRALVSTGTLSDVRESLAKVAAVVATTAHAGDGRPELPRAAIFAIASVANGVGPLSLVDTQWRGLQLNALRGGPLDKKGAGSRILNARGAIDAKEVSRLREFARDKQNHEGSSEPGLGLAELRAYMDANFERAAGRRRAIDRMLMMGAWPVFLKVMGMDGPGGRYLGLQDVIDLFKNRRLPERMNKRLRHVA
jgi:hypothetical protein